MHEAQPIVFCSLVHPHVPCRVDDPVLHTNTWGLIEITVVMHTRRFWIVSYEI